VTAPSSLRLGRGDASAAWPICSVRRKGSLSTWRRGSLAVGEGCTAHCRAWVIGARHGQQADSGGRGTPASARCATTTPSEGTRLGRLPGGWYGKGRHGGHCWMCRGWNLRIMERTERIDTECCGASEVRGHGVRRGIAGSSASWRAVIPVASAGVPRFRGWLMRWHVCAKARCLISVGSLSMSPYQGPLPRDQILEIRTPALKPIWACALTNWNVSKHTSGKNKTFRRFIF
jgi:hypothetical protein